MRDLKQMSRELLTEANMTPNQFETFWSSLWSYGCHWSVSKHFSNYHTMLTKYIHVRFDIKSMDRVTD